MLPKAITSTGLIFVALSQSALAATSCETLASLKLPDTTITLATEIASGAFVPADGGGRRGAAAFAALPAFCRVAGVIRPSSDSNIKFEVWMPLEGWNERFQGVGNGGLAGTISYPAMAAALSGGYATASTDTGHAAEADGTANWAMGSPDRIKDFGHRAVHEMTVKSKAVVAAYFGSQPRYSYWIGCSEGGRQGMGEAQRFPGDYDGIVAGAPVFGWTRTQTRNLGLQKIQREDPAAFVPGSKLKVLHQEVMNQCDTRDGVKDGVITHPPACNIDWSKMICKAGDQPNCLTASQAKLMQADYAGSSNPRTGERLMFGHAVGFEIEHGERTNFAETPSPNRLEASAFWRYFVFDDPKWDGAKFDFDKDVAFADQKVGGDMNNFDPNLRAFKARGGKLLHYHGWWDAQPTPYNSIDYHERVQKELGGNVSDFYRLFMVPGMGHCGGGPGTDQFDKIATIRAWVEEGKAPNMIHAEHKTDGKVDSSRPLCPHPQVAKYKGSGSTDEAASFTCALP